MQYIPLKFLFFFMINCWWMVLWPSLGRNTSSGLPHLTKTNAGQQIRLKSSLFSLTTDCMIGWQDLIDQYSTRYRRPLWVDCRQKKRKKSCFGFSKAADVALENILKVISLLEYCSCTWLSNNLDPVLTWIQVNVVIFERTLAFINCFHDLP